MKNTVKKLLLLLIVLLVAVPCFAATEDEVISEALIGQRIAQYNVDLNAPFTKETSGISERVNHETGAITYTLSLFSLNARTFEDTLSLSYSTYNAKLMQEAYNCSNGSFYYRNLDFSDLEITTEGFAVGWKLDLPYVEKFSDELYVHMPDGSVYLYSENEETGLKDYKLKDVKFVSLSNSFTLSYLNGTQYSFDKDGLLTRKSDRYGNFIDYIWNKVSSPYKLSSIASCTGKKIEFYYETDYVIVSNGDKKYEINRKKNSADDKIPFLNSVTDPENRTTQFSYGMTELDYTLGQDTSTIVNKYYPIESIVYHTGLETRYEYNVSKKNSGTGHLSYLKLAKRYDKAASGEISNIQSYAYSGEPDGYPSYAQGKLPSDYTYTSTVYNQDGSKEVFVYNSNHDTLSKTEYVNDIKRAESFYD